jgi:hypothetical protein
MSIRCPIFALLLLCFMVLPASAQDSLERPIAAITGGNVWLYALDGTGLKVSNGGAYHDPMWSPDGNTLAFLGTASVDPTQQSIYMTDWTGKPPIELVTGNIQFPVSFAPDGNLVYGLTIIPDATSDDASRTVEVYSVQPHAGASPTYLGTYDFLVACGAAVDFDPSDDHYRDETGYFDSQGAVLAATPWGVVHSTSCLENNQMLVLGTDQQTAFGYFTFLPQDRRDVFMLGSDRFSRIHNGQVVTEYVTGRVVDRMGFGAPGSTDLYYTTRTLTENITLPEEIAQALIANNFYLLLRRYTVSIHRLSLATGIDTELYTADAYGIGRLYGMADGSGLVFSQIPNPDAWVDALTDGDISRDDIAARNYKTDEYSQVELYYLDFGTGQARRVGTDMNSFVLNQVIPSAAPDAVFTPLPTVIAPTATSPTFAIGAQVVVNPELAALNVRATPDTSAAIVEVLPPGAVLTILEGPVEAAGYTWWRVRLPSTAEGWVVEHTGELPTLLPAS